MGVTESEAPTGSSATASPLPALSKRSNHLGHLLHPLEPIPVEVERDGINVLEPVVSVQTLALIRCLKIANQARFPLLFESPFD
jgi:hypothetical protein